MRIAVVAPSCTLDPTVPERVQALAEASFGANAPEIVFHPQCFLSEGHFAGPDGARIDALVEVANDPRFDAVWFARGGYGACRVAEHAISRMNVAARGKRYMGYSDAGFLLAGLYAHGIGRPAHGPMPADINRVGGDAAVARALAGLMNPPPRSPEKAVAFNLTVLSQLLGTSLQPDLTDHILMIEDVSEYMYRIDRSLFHITGDPRIRRAAGIALGRCSDIPPNDPDFGQSADQIVRHWCDANCIPFLGPANIGHDAENTVVFFG